MKKLWLAIALVAFAAGAGELITASVTGERSMNRLPYCVRIVSASLAASTNSAAIRLGVVREFPFGTNVVTATNLVFNGTPSKGVTNVVLAVPIYAVQGDRWLCDGVAATNGTAKAEVFMER